MVNLTDTGVPAAPSNEILGEAEQRATLRKVTWRLIPLLFFSYVIAYIDRINIGFAKLQLREVLGVEEADFSSAYGLGAGLFFIGYFIFEVPSNLILQKVGARIWLARIMIVWGFVSLAFMFLKGVTMFYVMRFLLGAAEAGFFPGVILYLTYWYPTRERARTIALFAVGGVAAGVVGSPISGKLLGLNGTLGLAGWQWLFLIEAIPAVLMGFVVYFALPNGPAQARWLTERERSWIQTRVREDALLNPAARHRLKDAFTSRHVWLFCLIYLLLNIGGYGFELWLPTIVKGLSGGSDAMVGWISAVPYFIAGVVMLIYGKHSDRTGERRGHIAVAATSATLGFALAAFNSNNPWLAMAGLTLAFAGVKCTIGPFWAWSTSFLSGTAAAGGIALVNSVGNLGGYFGPHLVGLLKDARGSDTLALLLLGSALLGMAICALLVPQKPSAMQSPPR